MNTLLNIICSKKVKYSILILFLLFLYVTICAFSYVNAVSTDIANSVFRLHVIANSDTDEDQNLKYIVRDNVLSYMNEICKDAKSKEEAICIANEHLTEFKQIAIDTIKENGFDYDVSVEIRKFFFSN